MVNIKYQEKWNLDSLFPGGSESDSLNRHLEKLVTMVNELKKNADFFQTPQTINAVNEIAMLMESINIINIHLSEAKSFIACLLGQNPKDQKATVLQSKVESIHTNFNLVIQKIQNVLIGTEKSLWNDLLTTDTLSNYTFLLNEWRKKGQLQLREKEEKIISDLTIDGYHSWRPFYNTLINKMTVPVPIEGKINKFSVGQAINLRSHPQEKVRKESYMCLKNVCTQNEDVFARVLNHITGFRLQVNKHKGINDVLIEPLMNNRMKEETLSAMWRAVQKHKKPFSNYLNKKAELIGETKLSFYNFWAPITEGKQQQISYKEAVNFIMEHLGQFGRELETFIRQAFEMGWVESENRSNKSAVAFCAGFPLKGESRVLMTYGGTIKDVLTLAHELGHAFHNYAMKDVLGVNKKYPLSIAETASTFAEMIVLDAAIVKQKSYQERILLLDEKLKRSVMNFMNIHSRFIFEKNVYKERKEGIISSSRLNELMEEAMMEGYDNSLDTIPNHSWIWTPHYYLTKSPFYNFPYTFGYLLSLHIYAKAKNEGKEFEAKYLALLRDSGNMSIEDLVKKHLGEDTTSEAFWEKGLEICINDVDEFIQLADEMSNEASE